VHKRGQIAPLTLSDVVSAGMCNICRHGARLELPLPGTMGVLMKLLKGLTQKTHHGDQLGLGKADGDFGCRGSAVWQGNPERRLFLPGARFFIRPPQKKPPIARASRGSLPAAIGTHRPPERALGAGTGDYGLPATPRWEPHSGRSRPR
jgi:hypothetical protein